MVVGKNVVQFWARWTNGDHNGENLVRGACFHGFLQTHPPSVEFTIETRGEEFLQIEIGALPLEILLDEIDNLIRSLWSFRRACDLPLFST